MGSLFNKWGSFDPSDFEAISTVIDGVQGQIRILGPINNKWRGEDPRSPHYRRLVVALEALLRYQKSLEDLQKSAMRNKTATQKELVGHVSPETAYVVNDYPYGSLRTQMRYWLEYRPKKGWRLVTQSLNPKTNRWNKPHPGVYTPIAASLYLDERGHAQWTGISEYDEPGTVLGFLKTFRNASREVLKIWIPAKIVYLKASLKKMKEEGLTGWTINGVAEKATQSEIAEKETQLEGWEEARKYL